MIYNAKNGSIPIGGTSMDYISFGSGAKNLILIAGIGDGLKTVRGTALPFSLMYNKLAAQFRVYVFSRRNFLPDGFSTRDMAADIAFAMDTLGIESARILGVSLGGMIAQYLAIDFPDKVEKLILTVTLSKPNDTLQSVIGGWLSFVRADDYKGIMLDTMEKSYSEKYLKKARRMYPLIGRFGKPKSFDRFIVMANACTAHNAYDELERISCPALIIGGKEDKIVTGKASEEISGKLAGSKLVLYDGLGHGTYEEAKDFIDRVIAFFG